MSIGSRIAALTARFRRSEPMWTPEWVPEEDAGEMRRALSATVAPQPGLLQRLLLAIGRGEVSARATH